MKELNKRLGIVSRCITCGTETRKFLTVRVQVVSEEQERLVRETPFPTQRYSTLCFTCLTASRSMDAPVQGGGAPLPHPKA